MHTEAKVREMAKRVLEQAEGLHKSNITAVHILRQRLMALAWVLEAPDVEVLLSDDAIKLASALW